MIERNSGIYGKELFHWMLRHEISRVERTNQPLSMLLLEISHIKKIVQTLSTIALNGIIKDIVRICDEDFRKTDIKGWYDNGIMAILMPDTSGTGASIACKKLADALARVFISEETSSHNHFDKACSIHTYPDSLLPAKKTLEKEPELKNSLPTPPVFPYNSFESYPKSPFQHFLKRATDLVVSTACLLLLSPVMVIIGLIIKLTSSGPILFKQVRWGYRGNPFTFYKFRSMYHGADEKSHREYVSSLIQGSHHEINRGSTQKPVLKMNNDPRITPFGSFLRKSSLDELPQLFNVLKGEMSLVGPRPPITYEVEKYRNWHLRRILEVKPGITGLWQVNGRSRCTFDEMVRMDLQYAKNWSIGMDIKILFKTITAVLLAKGAY